MFVNATPHEITVYDSEGRNVILRIPPSGNVIRLNQTSEDAGVLHIQQSTIPLVRSVYSGVTGVDDQNQGLTYIVDPQLLFHRDALYASAPGPDVYFIAPDVGDESVVRDENGNILGVRRFVTGFWS